MSTVLVTGGAGFIGSHLCERLLSEGYEIITLDNFNDFYPPALKRKNISAALAHPGYLLIEGDIRDEHAVNDIFLQHNIDTVIHLAALAGVRKSLSSPSEYIDVDVKGTVNLLECCRKYAVKKFVFASSSSVYGNQPAPFRETDRAENQVSPYAAAKRAGELFCRTCHLLYGLPVVCLRFFTVYGPRQRPEMAIHYFTRLIDAGKELPVFGSGESSRDYTYIDDIIDGIIASIHLECGFEIFNLGNAAPISLNGLVGLIEQTLGKNAVRRYLPMQQGDVEHTFADIAKAEKMLGYFPKTRMEEGIEKFVAWYRQRS